MTSRTRTKARRAAASSKSASGRTGPPRTGTRGRPATAPRRRWWKKRTPLLAATVAIVAVGATLLAVTGGSSAPPATAATVSGPPGPENVPLEEGPLLASASSAATGHMVDGVQCNSNEQVAYHVHTHLSVYVHGQLRPLPAGIGIVEPVPEQTAEGPFDSASRCYYWLHVHAQDGIIHIESPAGHSYTLGQFFDLWRQPLSPRQVGPATGTLTVFVNGRRYRGDPRAIALGSHVDIQIDVGSPVIAPKSVDWSATSL